MDTNTPKRDAANAVRVALAANEMTAKDLAPKVGMAESTLYRKLGRESDFTVPELHAIASALGVAPADLIGEAA